MAYTEDFKLKIQLEYQAGIYEKTEICKKHDLNRTTLDAWIRSGKWNNDRKNINKRIVKSAAEKVAEKIKKEKTKERKKKDKIKLKRVPDKIKKDIKAAKSQSNKVKYKKQNKTKAEPANINILGVKEKVIRAELFNKQAAIEEITDVKEFVLTQCAVEYSRNSEKLNYATVSSLKHHVQDLTKFRITNQILEDKFLQMEYKPTCQKWKEAKQALKYNEEKIVFSIGLFATLQKAYKSNSETLQNNFEGMRLALGITDASDKGKINMIQIDKCESDEDFVEMVEKDQLQLTEK